LNLFIAACRLSNMIRQGQKLSLYIPFSRRRRVGAYPAFSGGRVSLFVFQAAGIEAPEV
jgi:hypothetical protein